MELFRRPKAVVLSSLKDRPRSNMQLWPQAACTLIFFLLGLIFIPYAGIQNDEALPQSQLFEAYPGLYSWRLFHHEIPVMVLSYLGSLKTWLYVPIVHLWRPAAYSIRIPALLCGAATVWIFGLLLERVHSRLAAWIGMLLLTTDSMFLLTTVFDWGPVALQHLLATCGIFLMVVHSRHQRTALLMGSLFCFGLALWDKALFLWLGTGLACAGLFVFPQQVWNSLSLRRAILASAALCLGAFPFIAYNVTQGFPTLHATSGFTTQEVLPKFLFLRGSWEGAGLFGYLVNPDLASHPKRPSGAVEQASFWIRNQVGECQHNLLTWGFLVSLACAAAVCFTPAGRVLLFTVLAMSIAWFQMAVTRNAGAGIHHTVLLWPLPHMFMAVAFAAFAIRFGKAARWAVLILVIGLTAANLLLMNQYLYQFARDGARGSWTDAIYPLSAGLASSPSSHIAVIDWGLINSLEAMNEGKLPLSWAGDPFMERPTGSPPVDPDPELLRDPNTLWVGHTDGNEQFAGVNASVIAFAARSGYEKTPVRLYYDSNGRAIFQTFRLIKPERR